MKIINPATGFRFAPTVLIDVDHTMELMREESFGPVIGSTLSTYGIEAFVRPKAWHLRSG